MQIERLITARFRPAADEDALTRMIALGQALPPVDRLALASTSMPEARRVRAGLVALALGLPARTFCLESTTSHRAATEAMRALGTGLLLAADGDWAAALLLGDGPGEATVLAMQSALQEDPGLPGDYVPDYAEAAYLEILQRAAAGLEADLLALNPPQPRLARPAARALGFSQAVTAPVGAGAAGPLIALRAALDQAAPGQRVLLVSYGAGSAADALLVRKEGG